MTQSEKLIAILADTGYRYTMAQIANELQTSKERARVVVMRQIDYTPNQVTRFEDGQRVSYMFFSKPQKTKAEQLWRLALFGESIS